MALRGPIVRGTQERTQAFGKIGKRRPLKGDRGSDAEQRIGCSPLGLTKDQATFAKFEAPTKSHPLGKPAKGSVGLDELVSSKVRVIY